MATTKVDRIAELLAQGLPAAMVASITASSPSYISQLCSNPDFMEHINLLKIEAAELEQDEASAELMEFENYKNKVRGAENLLLDRVIENIHYLSLPDTLRALTVIGARADAIDKRKLTDFVANGGLTPQITNQTIISLELPAAMLPDIEYSDTNEIIKIGARTTAPMPTQTLQKLLDKEAPSLLQTQFGQAETIAYEPIGDS